MFYVLYRLHIQTFRNYDWFYFFSAFYNYGAGMHQGQELYRNFLAKFRGTVKKQNYQFNLAMIWG